MNRAATIGCAFLSLTLFAACANEGVTADESSATSSTTAGSGGSGGEAGSDQGGGSSDKSSASSGGDGGSAGADGSGGEAASSGEGGAGQGGGSSSGEGGSEPSSATRMLLVVFPGNPAGSFAGQRFCMGSPVEKGDYSPDKQAQFLPWPSQASEPKPVAKLNTWESFGGDVLSSKATYAVEVKTWVDADLRFQCYDMNGAQVSFGCMADEDDNLVEVFDEDDNLVPLVSAENLNDGYNCQTVK